MSLPTHPVNSAPQHGVSLLKDGRENKGLAFSLHERQILGLHGLQPPAIFDQTLQVDRIMRNIRAMPDDLSRYIELSWLQERNERLYYAVLNKHVDELMPIVYTPTVGLACQKFGLIYKQPKGLYITIHDSKPHQIDSILSNWPANDIRVIVVTDGERILGLGDLGANGMGIPVGKLALYVALAGIPPQWCLPVVLDVGTDRKELLEDPFYLGLRQNRVRGQQYDDFIDNFMKAVVKRYGQNCLIQFEDFGNSNAFRLIEKYKPTYCTFNDDIQGTASVAVAGILAGTRLKGQKVSDNKFLFLGAGEAAIGIARLTCMAMVKEGLKIEEARARIFMVDSKGLIVKGREAVTVHKADFAQSMEHIKDFADVVKAVKPTVLIGAATQPGAFTKEIIECMAANSPQPVIFALSNPTSKAECTAQQAYEFSQYKAIFASGSPFDPVNAPDGRRLEPGQGNNAYIFPGVGLGVIAAGVKHITEEHFLVAAETLSHMVSDEHWKLGRVYPPLSMVREISVAIAVTIMEHAYKHNEASLHPQPDNLKSYVESMLYSTDYPTYAPEYDWPKEVATPRKS